eukprot:scaffold22762_cov127-Cylindrotheca_fusiformis.AAC.2
MSSSPEVARHSKTSARKTYRSRQLYLEHIDFNLENCSTSSLQPQTSCLKYRTSFSVFTIKPLFPLEDCHRILVTSYQRPYPNTIKTIDLVLQLSTMWNHQNSSTMVNGAAPDFHVQKHGRLDIIENSRSIPIRAIIFVLYLRGKSNPLRSISFTIGESCGTVG